MSILSQTFRAVVVGATGGIGAEVTRQLAENPNAEKVYALSRRRAGLEASNVAHIQADILDENSLESAASEIKNDGQVQLVFVATGLLHGENVFPEKALRDLNLQQMDAVFKVNTFGPGLVAKHFEGLLDNQTPSVFAVISARVGSISDNRLGGWYSYRASKSALNMLLRGMSIEVGRRNKQAIILGLHPGTVNTGLSEPFQSNVPEGKLFSPKYSAEQMLAVVDGATCEQSGRVFDYAGKEVPA